MTINISIQDVAQNLHPKITVLYDQDSFKIDFLANQTKKSKKQGITGFFTWLDQYI